MTLRPAAPAEPRSRQPRSLKASLAWLLATVFVPLLVAALAFLASQWANERDQALVRLKEQARTLRDSLDRELTLDLAVLGALAASRDIDEQDWRRLDAVARETSRVRPGSWIVLLDQAGQQVLNTAVPFGTPLPNIRNLGSPAMGRWQGREIPFPDSSLMLKPLDDGQPTFSDLFYGPVVKRPTVGNNIAVLRGGKPLYALDLAYGAEFFQRLVGDPAPDAIKVILDGRGLIVARNRAPEKYVGLPAPGVFAPGTARLPPEAVGELTSIEGNDVFFAHSRSTINDWVVAVALPKSTVLAPAWHAVQLWLAILASVALISGFFAVRLWRHLAIPLDALAARARTLGHADPAMPALPRTDIEEVHALARALQEAGLNAQALRDSKAQLEESDRRRSEFLSMLSHELRNPLAAISNATAILVRSPDQPSRIRALHEMLQRQTRHIARMVDDLLDVARITRGKIQIQREPVRMDELVRHVAADARPMMDGKAHHLEVSATEGAWVEGDEARLKQVIGNLVDNAAKYTEPGGRIALELTREAGEAVVRVRDNGPGIEAALLPHVFELFTQGPRTLDRSQGGLGIGLALVKTLVEMHGGRVDAASVAGSGSEFTVRLPLADSAAIPGARAGASASLRGQRILIVEDNVDAAESLAILMQLEGAEPELAYDGVQGLEKARRWRPDAILLDVGLPAMSGYEVCRALRGESWGGEVSIIAVTGWGQQDDVRNAKAAGFDGHLVKPVDAQVVVTLLHDLASRAGASRR